MTSGVRSAAPVPSGTALPTLRAVVLDARTERAPLPQVALAGERTAHVVVIPALTRRDHALTTREPGVVHTRDAVEIARGTDVVVVIAGADVAGIARDCRILVACGVRTALIGVLGGTTDEEERNCRHLLTGAGMLGDDAGIVRLDDENLAEAVAASPTRALLDGFVAVCRARSGGALYGRVIEGALHASAGTAHMLASVTPSAGQPLWTARAFTRFPVPSNQPPLGLLIDERAARRDDEVVVASEPIPGAARFAVSDAFPSIEPCIAFGGRGGWGQAKIGGGFLDVDRPICPLPSGKVGVIFVKGAGLGPVRILDDGVLR